MPAPPVISEPRVARDGMHPLIETRGLTKTYPGGVTALDGLDLTIPRGTIGLVGANGAGKSTFFRVLLGLTRPDRGEVVVDGLDVGADPIGVRMRLGFMPEHDAMPTDASASDFVASYGELAGLPARAARQRASDMLDLVGLDEARFRPIEGFSTGMRQRTKLAQALVADPTLVLLDEPTAGLDPAGRAAMLALVRRLGTFGISIIMATHLLDDVAATCDQVVMIDAGRLVAAGPTAALLETTGFVSVDVDGRGEELLPGLAAAGIQATIQMDGSVEVVGDDDATLDHVVAAVAAAGLPLHAMSSKRSTLDEVFVDHRRTGERLGS